jgi:hypothetical protein
MAHEREGKASGSRSTSARRLGPRGRGTHAELPRAGLQTAPPLPILMRRSEQVEAAMIKQVAGAACVIALSLFAADAQARIICNGAYQVVNGQEISTPYCNDNYVAAVARARGRNVSDEAVRNNPSVKEEICLWIGKDHRIREYCDQYDDSDKR